MVSAKHSEVVRSRLRSTAPLDLRPLMFRATTRAMAAYNKIPAVLPKLPFAYNALEPAISSQIMPRRLPRLPRRTGANLLSSACAGSSTTRSTTPPTSPTSTRCVPRSHSACRRLLADLVGFARHLAHCNLPATPRAQAHEDIQAASQAQDIKKQIALQAAIKFNGGGASCSSSESTLPHN